jgi:hypothetical protein
VELGEIVEYLYDNWVGLSGLIATVVGLGIAIRQVIGARRAAEAAEGAASAAQRATIETRDAIHGVLTVSDLRRVIGYVQQIKSFHRDQQWDICLNMYQVLRSSLTDIRSRLPEPAAQYRLVLREAIDQVNAIENTLDVAVRSGSEFAASEDFNSILNEVQAKLEEMVSRVQVQESEVSTQ